MKEKMKKLTLLTFHRDKNRVTDQLHQLGVLHILPAKGDFTSTEQEKLQSELSKWKKATSILREYKPDNSLKNNAIEQDLDECITTILNLVEEKTALQNEATGLVNDKTILEPWGNFDLSKIKELENHQIFVSFFSSSEKDFKKFNFGDALPIIVSSKGRIFYFTVVEFKTHQSFPFTKIVLPSNSLAEIDKREKDVQRKMEVIEKKLEKFSSANDLINLRIQELEDKLDNRKARQSYEEKAKGAIEILMGWFPERSESALLKFINENQLSYDITDPEPGEKIPVILKNQKYPKIFEAVTKVFQLPNYYEFDLTPFIAVFFPIFFGYCLGDAGYGLILIILSIISANTFFKQTKSISLLLGILGLATTIIGILKSGTIFGIPVSLHKDFPIFAFLSKYVIITDNQDFIFNAFNVALIIGVFQILVAILISIGKKIHFDGFIVALPTIGKLFTVGSLIVLFLGGIQELIPFKSFVGISKVFLTLGILLILFFHDTRLSLGRRLGSGILPLYFIITGLLGDVLSYIRLFALGVASSILGLVVNQIGSQMMTGSGVIGITFGILFLIVGHSLNFLLACLGAFVHPLRLTFVEFYNNANFTGGGIPYKPFKKHSIRNITNN